VLNSLSDMERGQLNRHNFSLQHNFSEYPGQYHDRISKASMEAWGWLEREGLIAGQPGQQGDRIFITRRGQKIKSSEDLSSFSPDYSQIWF